MDKVRLGKTELYVSKPAMGCLPIQRCEKDYAIKLLLSAYNKGINYFDTANAYTDSEEKIGLALADVRENIVISTKSGAHDKETILLHIENSLKMLKTSYIDLFQFHKLEELPDFNDPEGIYSAALIAKERGWIKHIGFTTHRIDVAEKGIESGMFETCQFPFSYISSDRDLALAKKCKDNDMGFIAMKGLAGGMLSNAEACTAFMNQYDNVVPIWGIQKLEELDEWIEYSNMDLHLNDEIAAFINEERNALSKNFCRSCGYCMPCTVGIEIRNCARMDMLLRRSPWQEYMSDEWYAKMMKINDCINCRQCVSKCPYGIDQPSVLKYMLNDYLEFYKTHKPLMGSD